MPRYLIIVNPAAKSGKASDLIPTIKSDFAGQDYALLLSEAPGHPKELVQSTVDSNTECVIAVGGDGTTSEVVNGIMSLTKDKRPALGIISAGSGNDAVRGFGLPTDTREATRAILAGTTRLFDVGRVNDRYFASSFSIGLDANVVEQTLEYKEANGWSGSRLYYTSLMKVIFTKLQPIELDIQHLDHDKEKGAEKNCKAKVLLCATTNGHTYGGGIPINPDATTDSGRLAFAWVDSLSFPETMLRLPLIVTGKHRNLKAYHRNEIKNAVVQSSNGTKLTAQTDGELFWDTSFKVELFPGELEVIVPAD